MAHVPLSLRSKWPGSVAAKPMSPISVSLGKNDAVLAPICALLDARPRSAARISGRWRSTSTGLPMATVCGSCGSGGGWSPAFRRASSVPGAAQHRQGIHGLLDLRVDRDQRGLRAFELAAQLIDVGVGRGAARAALLRQLQHLLLQLCRLPHQRIAQLHVAQADIILRHFGRQRHVRVVQIGLAGFRLGRRGFDGAPRAAEQVDLPCRVEADVDKVSGPRPCEVVSAGAPFDAAGFTPAASSRPEISGERVRKASALADPLGPPLAWFSFSADRAWRKRACAIWMSGELRTASSISALSWSSCSAAHQSATPGALETPSAGAPWKPAPPPASGAAACGPR